jgi:hypothetical protein
MEFKELTTNVSHVKKTQYFPTRRNLFAKINSYWSQDSTVGAATPCGLDGPGFKY